MKTLFPLRTSAIIVIINAVKRGFFKPLVVIIPLSLLWLSSLSQTNYSLNFTASDDHVQVPYSPVLQLGTSNFTLEAWIKLASTQPSFPQILSNRDNVLEGFLFGIWTNGHPYMQIDGINNIPSTGNDLRDNTWHHVAAVRTGSSIAYYVDGVQKGGFTSTLSATNQSLHPLLIGWDDGNRTQTAFNGLIDDVRIWNIAQDAAYLQGYQQNCLTGFEAGLIGYWPFNEGAGTITTDLSSSGNHAILKNNPTWSADVFNLTCQTTVQTPNAVHGNIFADENSNCIKNGQDRGLNRFLVRSFPDNFFGISDANGDYSVGANSGMSGVRQIIPNQMGLLVDQICPSNPDYYTVTFDSLGQDSTGFDFANEVIECPLLTVDLCSNRRRRCFANLTMIQYCNEGYAPADSVTLYVQLPEYVYFLGADAPYTVDADSNFVFYIGTLNPGECGNITITDSVPCLPDILGLIQCTRAWLTPANNCVHAQDSSFTNWDRSSIAVTVECMKAQGIFTITNNGADMQGYSVYRIYADSALVETDSFMLAAGESLVINMPSQGMVIRLEADQRPGHPGHSHPTASNEDCFGSNDFSNGARLQFPSDDEDPEVEEQCFPIVDSSDPNDKSVMPTGILPEHAVKPGVMLEYIVRFQNTGTDTAYNVVVVDSLSPDLDISTIEFGVSSHPYELNVTGEGAPVLNFTFNNIMLPPMSNDDLRSQGFVKFKITPNTSVAEGTVIHNSAEIYFDFNAPIRTNDPWVSISDTVVYDPSQTISGAIISETGLPVPGVTVNLTGSQTETVTTLSDGLYKFEISSMGDCTVSLSKNNDVTVLNGITTLDIVLMQRQILAIQALGSPYKILAADVDASSTVTTMDIVLTRAMILANTSSYPGNKLWKFVRSDFVFADPLQPFAYVNSRSYVNIFSNQSGQNFIGIKLGDVNNSWDPATPKTDAVGSVQLAVGRYNAMRGDEIMIPVKVKDFHNITGYQFTLLWDAEVISLLDVNNKSVEGFYGTERKDEGLLTTSWNSETMKAMTLDDEAVVFELKFKVIGENGMQSEIKIVSEPTVSEAYNGNLDLLDIVAANGMVKVGDVLSVVSQQPSDISLAVQPNPFSNSAQIVFTIPEDATVNISIYDLMGKEVKMIQADYKAGEHHIEWTGDDERNVLTEGLYHVRMISGGVWKGVRVAVVR